MTNRLGDATSPYLLQHRDNPVDWQEWGDEAFEEARERNVPVLLSVGYAACHWCHVMAHESFEDESVAAALNEHFVAVKVDREERPDIDAAYMSAVTATTGHGGWPMTSSSHPRASRSTAARTSRATSSSRCSPPSPRPGRMRRTRCGPGAAHRVRAARTPSPPQHLQRSTRRRSTRPWGRS